MGAWPLDGASHIIMTFTWPLTQLSNNFLSFKIGQWYLVHVYVAFRGDICFSYLKQFFLVRIVLQCVWFWKLSWKFWMSSVYYYQLHFSVGFQIDFFYVYSKLTMTVTHKNIEILLPYITGIFLYWSIWRCLYILWRWLIG